MNLGVWHQVPQVPASIEPEAWLGRGLWQEVTPLVMHICFLQTNVHTLLSSRTKHAGEAVLVHWHFAATHVKF